MKGKRLITTLRLLTILSANKRTAYLRKKKIFASIGDNVMIMDRVVPLYPELISIGNNLQIASNVHFVTHDVSHVMINKLPVDKKLGGYISGTIRLYRSWRQCFYRLRNAYFI